MPPVTRSQAAKNSATGTQVAEHLAVLDAAMTLLRIRYGDGYRAVSAKVDIVWRTPEGAIAMDILRKTEPDTPPIAHRLPERACRMKAA